MNPLNKIRSLLGLPLDPELRLDPETYNFYANVANLQGLTYAEWVERALEVAAAPYFPKEEEPREPTVAEPFVDDRHPCKWWTGVYVNGDQMFQCGHPEGNGRPCRWPGPVARQCSEFYPRRAWRGV